jgi:hypothetical protein
MAVAISGNLAVSDIVILVTDGTDGADGADGILPILSPPKKIFFLTLPSEFIFFPPRKGFRNASVPSVKLDFCGIGAFSDVTIKMTRLGL